MISQKRFLFDDGIRCPICRSVALAGSLVTGRPPGGPFRLGWGERKREKKRERQRERKRKREKEREEEREGGRERRKEGGIDRERKREKEINR